jgi:RecA/RadA recombinase
MAEIERDSITTFSTGCPIIDQTLGGGIRLGQITELYGESGCGKTQLCIQMSLEVQRTFRARGQEASEHLLLIFPCLSSSSIEVVYINTESQIEKIDKRLRHISYYRAKADKPFNIADARCLQQKFFDNIYIDIVRHYVSIFFCLFPISYFSYFD